jgi:hypothetical protein
VPVWEKLLFFSDIGKLAHGRRSFVSETLFLNIFHSLSVFGDKIQVELRIVIAT